MMYMVGFYDHFDKPYTLVKEVDQMFIVPMSPFEILHLSIRQLRMNYNSDMETPNLAHLDKKKIPFVMNPFPNIVLFSTKPSNRSETIWFNPLQIVRTEMDLLNKTIYIVLKNREILTVDSSLSTNYESLKTKEPHHNMKCKEPKNSFSFIIDPKNKNLLIFLAAYKFFTEIFDVIC